MAVTVPSDLELFDKNQLIGAIRANSSDPLHTLLRRTNWLYATWRPPLISMACESDASSSQQYVTSAVPSADGLTYECHLTFWASASSGNVSIAVEESSTSSSSGWSAVSGSPFTHALSGAGDQQATFDIPIAAASRYFRLTVTPPSGTVQVQHWLVLPDRLSSLGFTSARSSGFIPYDDAYLSGVAGAAIHTEYINRCWRNAYYVVADRRQCVFSVAELASGAKNRYQRTGNLLQALAYFGVPFMPPGPGEYTCTVRMRAEDGGNGGQVRVQQLGRASVVLDADDADNTASLTLSGPNPTLSVVTLPGASGSIQFRYLAFDWQRTDIGSTAELVRGPAPPARAEYIIALETATLAAALEPYVSPVIQSNFYNAEGTYYHWHYVIPPASRRLRTAWVRSLDEAATTPSDTEAYSATSGANPQDAITVPADGSGTEQYGPMAAAPHVVLGSLDDEDGPSAAQNRMFEVPTDREANVEHMYARYAVGFSGLVQPEDLGSV